MAGRRDDSRSRFGRFTPKKGDRDAVDAQRAAEDALKERGVHHSALRKAALAAMRAREEGAPAAHRTLSERSVLLGVDLGLATGLAHFNRDGRLVRVHSHRFASRDALRRGVADIVGSIEHLAWVVAEGGGPIAESWERAAQYRGVPIKLVHAEQWRPRFMYPREHRDSDAAKRHAQRMAREVIAWSGLKGVGEIRHDAAEAIMVGLWGVIEIGWLRDPPALGHGG